MTENCIEIIDAHEHNLKHLDIKIPRDKLVVITGLSGSGKSSLAFDTIFAEGQRRFVETLSNYTRIMLGGMERPAVEKINGLSPVISIEQKTSGWNPRSTLGTVTELYDLMRLMFARMGEAYSYISGKKMVKFSEEQVLEELYEKYQGKSISILAPVVKGRKGHYKELFENFRKQGYTKVRIDGEIEEIKSNLQVDRYKIHNIEIIIDEIKIEAEKSQRLGLSIALAMKLGEGSIKILSDVDQSIHLYNKALGDAENDIYYEEPSPNTFSFNSPFGACPKCNGLGELFEVDIKKVIPNDQSSLNEGGIVPFGLPRETNYFNQLRSLFKKYNALFSTPIKDLSQELLSVILYGKNTTKKDKKVAYNEYAYDISTMGLFEILRLYYLDTKSERMRQWAEEFMTLNICPTCNGDRLKIESLHFKINEKNIAELNRLSLEELASWIDALPKKLNSRQQKIGIEIIKELQMRVHFLNQVGLNYLSLNRTARSLSGGESQRARLANQIGSQLTGVLYILDEPSIGLHQRDNQKLIQALRNLTSIGNSVIVVEHDKDIMLMSDYIIDMGPGAGIKGGNITGQGSPEEFLKLSNNTAQYLSGKKNILPRSVIREGNGKYIDLINAYGNNLKNINLTIPLGKLIMVTGVSGSGKSSLIIETLYPIIRKHLYKSLDRPLPYDDIKGLNHIDKIIEIDQTPIGRSTRSNPVTYINIFSDIRNLYANIPEAKIRGYKAGRFSFNVKGGRCETCEGGGKKVFEMNFLPDVLVTCETCNGKRYNHETLQIIYKNKSIGDVLDLTVDEAVVFFEAMPKIYKKIKTLQEVGLGYITLGQQATTLSGGEAQRVKLSEELSKRDTGNTLYILDEPTTGLHFEDISMLLDVLQSLVDKGNTVLVIEHNLDMIKCADHIIDIGPEGGTNGGMIVAEGSPNEVAKNKKSLTSQFLKKELELVNI